LATEEAIAGRPAVTVVISAISAGALIQRANNGPTGMCRELTEIPIRRSHDDSGCNEYFHSERWDSGQSGDYSDMRLGSKVAPEAMSAGRSWHFPPKSDGRTRAGTPDV